MSASDFTFTGAPAFRGGQATVYKVESSDSQLLAIKLVPKNEAGRNEVECIKALRHPNIVPAVSIVDDPVADMIQIRMPFIPATLLDMLQQSLKGFLTEARARNFFLQILSAIEFMHSQGIAHKDIKLENVLVDEETNRCMLADFGLSQRFDRKTRLQDNTGSLHYSAPELWKQEPYVGPEVDVWALGVTLYLLVTGVFPFGGTTPDDVATEIFANDIWFPPSLNPELQDLLRRMLEPDLHQRITIADIFLHPWVKKGIHKRIESFAGS